MSTVHVVNRRDFLKTTGLAGSALILGVNVLPRRSEAGVLDDADFQPNVFIGIDEDGTITLTVHRQELGQGGRTACAMMLAEELEVAIDDVAIVQAVGDLKYGGQHTAGSTTVVTSWTPLRTAGAAAREMLIAAAATNWGVAASECRCERGEVIHGASGRRLVYGELASAAAVLPVPDSPELKRPEDYKIIGKPTRMIDVPAITSGAAIFGYDITVPGMLYASLERSPRVRGTIKSYDADAARAVDGVVDVVELEAGASGLNNNSIAVVAENSWAALEGRKALAAEWDSGPLPDETSAEYGVRLEEIASQPGRAAREEGDVDAALAAADRVIEAVYTGPYLAHSPMEPPVATARIENGVCEVWASAQAPMWARQEVAAAIGFSPADVTVHVPLVGGAFGRKSKPDSSVEAAMLAQKIGRPVRVAFTKEDDIRHGFYRAQNCQKYIGAIDGDGNVSGLLARSVFPAIGWQFSGVQEGPYGGALSQGFSNIPYRIPNLRLESGAVGSSLRIGWLRSVHTTFHAFGVNSFIDELAHATGRDPVAFHLELLGEPRILEPSNEDRANPYRFDTGRLSQVIEAAAEMGNWGRELPEGHGLGIAAQYSFRSYVAMVAHVSVDASGDLTVHEIHAAVDCGPVVNPLTVEAQMQGAVGIGLSFALHGKITVKDSVVEQSNYHDYPVVRLDEMPTVHSRFIQTEGLPAGIGEPGVPPAAPAVVNAIFAATGVRIRDLPIAGQNLR
jgi:isoquinoline 1-oxidoreductase beta subunit